MGLFQAAILIVVVVLLAVGFAVGLAWLDSRRARARRMPRLPRREGRRHGSDGSVEGP